jgi:precorrin-2 dehydrogenase/sirohydrochlorin ferrochelatase
VKTGGPARYYPVFLALEGRLCLVVGGGTVATGKVKGLIAAGAAVRIVSPALTQELNGLVSEGRAEYSRRPYEESDIEGTTLVMAATNDPEVNAAVAADCRARGIWVNSADDPPHCDFILPSVIRRGKVTVAASTSGASPALARKLREELESFLSEDFGALADLLGEVRTELQLRAVTVSGACWQEAIDDDLRSLVANGLYEKARQYLLNALGVESSSPSVRDGNSLRDGNSQ